MNNEEIVEKLVQLGMLQKMVEDCRNIIHTNGFLGGHRGNSDDLLSFVSGYISEEIDSTKEMMKNEKSDSRENSIR